MVMATSVILLSSCSKPGDDVAMRAEQQCLAKNGGPEWQYERTAFPSLAEFCRDKAAYERAVYLRRTDPARLREELERAQERVNDAR